MTPRLLTAAVCTLVLAIPSVAAAATTRVSVAADGTEATDSSHNPAISGDGHVVAFTSNAANLVAGDTNNAPDIFVRMPLLPFVQRVSVDSAGGQLAEGSSIQPTLSDDGRLVTFAVSGRLYVRDLSDQTTTRVDVAAGGGDRDGSFSHEPVISGNGRYVAFSSDATNLVADDHNHSLSSAFVRDLQSGTTELVSMMPSGEQSNSHATAGAISDDGRYVVFKFDYGIYIRDLQTQTTQRVDVGNPDGPGHDSFPAALTPDGRYVLFASNAPNLVEGETSTRSHVYVRDRTAATTELIDVSDAGQAADLGSFHDAGDISDDGRFVVFQSASNNLVTGDSVSMYHDVFLRDRHSRTTSLADVNDAGTQSDAGAHRVDISADARYVAFASEGTNLAPGDTAACTTTVFDPDGEPGEEEQTIAVSCQDIFVNDRGDQAPVPGSPQRVGSGGTVSTTDTATSAEPVAVALTSPNAGIITMQPGATDTAAPAGYTFLGQQVEISAPDGTPEDPLQIVFQLDASLLPAGVDATNVQVFRNDVAIADCTQTTPLIEPIPCISERTPLSSGDAQITVLSDHASRWNFGTESPVATACDLVLSPVGCWGFGEAPGSTTAVDSSPPGNNGTYLGNPTLGVLGVRSTAVVMDGINDVVRVPDANSLDVGDSFSLEGWIKRGTSTKTQQMFLKANGFQLAVMNAANGNRVWLRKANVSTIVRSAAPVPADGRYHHIVATKNGPHTAKIYVDGQPSTLPVSPGQIIPNTAFPLTFGAAANGQANFDEFAVYDVALTAAQVQARFAAGDD